MSMSLSQVISEKVSVAQIQFADISKHGVSHFMEDFLMGFYRTLVHSSTNVSRKVCGSYKEQQTSEHQLIQSHEIPHFTIFYKLLH